MKFLIPFLVLLAMIPLGAGAETLNLDCFGTIGDPDQPQNIRLQFYMDDAAFPQLSEKVYSIAPNYEDTGIVTVIEIYYGDTPVAIMVSSTSISMLLAGMNEMKIMPALCTEKFEFFGRIGFIIRKVDGTYTVEVGLLDKNYAFSSLGLLTCEEFTEDS